MDIIDKTVSATVKTTAAVTAATGELVRNSASTAVDLAVNFTPDFYDEHYDFSKGTALTLGGNSIMVARTGVRIFRSAKSVGYKEVAKSKNRKAKRRQFQIQNTNEQIDRYSQLKKKIERTGNYSPIQSEGITNRYVSSKIKKYQNQVIDLERKKKKLLSKEKKYLKRSVKNKRRGFKPKQSFKRTVSNQTRKTASSLSNNDDSATKSVGISIKGVWAGLKFKRRAKPLLKTTLNIASSLISSVISFITSLPAIIASLVSMLPIIIVVSVVMLIFAPFISMTYSGRIGTLYMKINELNTIYDVDIDPAEVLAITDVLEWTTQDEEQYEQLFSLMLDQTKGNQLTFEEMAYNVFIKYNPVNKYKTEAIYSDDMKTGYYYWSLEGLDLNFLVSNPVKRNLLYNEYLKLYPAYKRAGEELLKKMKTASYQNNLIEIAKDKIEINQQRYEDYIYEYQLGDIELDVSGDNEKGIAVVKKALTKLGCDYIWGAGHGKEYKNPDLKEFDCSGLVSWSFYQSGINIGDQTTKTLIKMGKSVSKNQLQPGDIVLFNTSGDSQPDHVGIYIGDGKMVHAPHTGDVVKITNITSSYYVQRLVGCRRLY